MDNQPLEPDQYISILFIYIILALPMIYLYTEITNSLRYVILVPIISLIILTIITLIDFLEQYFKLQK